MTKIVLSIIFLHIFVSKLRMLLKSTSNLCLEEFQAPYCSVFTMEIWIGRLLINLWMEVIKPFCFNSQDRILFNYLNRKELPINKMKKHDLYIM